LSNNNTNIISNISDDSVEVESKKLNPSPETIVENIVESGSIQEEVLPEATTGDSNEKQETQQSFVGVTSNNYVSS
jgi:hypothetical protein